MNPPVTPGPTIAARGSDRECQPGYRPGGPAALLGAGFVLTWLLWLGAWALPRWQHPLVIAMAALLLPLVAFIVLNLVNLALAGLVQAAQALVPGLRRRSRQEGVGWIIILATSALAIRLGFSDNPWFQAGAALWVVALVVHLLWRWRTAPGLADRAR